MVRRYIRHSPEFRAEVVDYCEKNSIQKALDVYSAHGLTYKQIWHWANQSNKNLPRTHKGYSDELKQEVREYAKGKPLKEVAEKYKDISKSTLYGWIKQPNKAKPTNTTPKNKHANLKQKPLFEAVPIAEKKKPAPSITFNVSGVEIQLSDVDTAAELLKKLSNKG